MTTTTMLEQGRIEVCKPRGMAKQFGHPTGLIGSLVGKLMAVKNRPMNDLVVDLLDLQLEDSVLEIGFGPGTAIERIAHTTQAGFVAGVDPSDVMISQATRRNRKWVEEGRVELRQGTASQLPFDDGLFTTVSVSITGPINPVDCERSAECCVAMARSCCVCELPYRQRNCSQHLG